jgi:hypothetical protein
MDHIVVNTAAYATHNTGKTLKLSAVFEPAIPVTESLRQHGHRDRLHVYYGGNIANFMYEYYTRTNIT